MRIVLTGGMSGGHLLPLAPVIEELRALEGDAEIFFVGVVDERAKDFFNELKVTTINVPAAKMRRYASSNNIIDIVFRLPIGIVLALWHIWRLMPDVVLVKGGGGSLPVALASIFYRIPYLLHESDAVMGSTNRLLTPGASVVAVSFHQTRHAMGGYSKRTVVTGVPVRDVRQMPDRRAAREFFKLSADKPLVLITGGSQGAEQLNKVTLEVLPSLLRDFSVIHQAGEDKVDDVRRDVRDRLGQEPAGYRLFGYLKDEMKYALAAADLVVARAGASTLAELAVLGKAAIVVPLDSAAQDHQRRNAEMYEEAGALRVIDPANLGRALFERNVRNLVATSDLRATLEKNIARLARPQAASQVAELLIRLAAGEVPRQLVQSENGVKKR